MSQELKHVRGAELTKACRSTGNASGGRGALPELTLKQVSVPAALSKPLCLQH